jgi:hypothetical protein
MDNLEALEKRVADLEGRVQGQQTINTQSLVEVYESIIARAATRDSAPKSEGSRQNYSQA